MSCLAQVKNAGDSLEKENERDEKLKENVWRVEEHHGQPSKTRGGSTGWMDGYTDVWKYDVAWAKGQCPDRFGVAMLAAAEVLTAALNSLTGSGASCQITAYIGSV